MDNQRPVHRSAPASNLLARLLLARELGILLFLAIEVVFLRTQTTVFLTPDNLTNVATDLTWIAVMGVGQAFVIMTGGVDLSVGSILGLSSVIAAVLSAGGKAPGICVLAGLGAGLAAGLFNGIFVAKVRLPPFIVTLASLSLMRGMALKVTGSETITGLSDRFLALGRSVFTVPIPVIVMLAVVVAGTLFIKRTRWGRYILAIGGNETAARLSGVPTDRVKILVYALSGLCAGLAGVMFAAKLGVGQSTSGTGYELDVVAAVVIGGTSLAGGQGSIPGAVLGAIVMGVLRNGLVLLGVQEHWTYLSTGAVILIAAAVDVLTNRKAAAK